MGDWRWILTVALGIAVAGSFPTISWYYSAPGETGPIALWFAFLAVIGNTYRDFLAHLFWPAILALDESMRPEDKMLVPIMSVASTMSGTPRAFYYQLLVRNKGPATATELSVMLVRIEQWDAHTKTWSPRGSNPLNLQWAFRSADAFYPYLPRGAARHCTLGSCKDPFMLFIDPATPTLSKKRSTFDLELEVTPTAAWPQLEAGLYRVNLLLSSKNGWTTQARIAVAYSGKWSDNPNEMIQVRRTR